MFVCKFMITKSRICVLEITGSLYHSKFCADAALILCKKVTEEFGICLAQEMTIQRAGISIGAKLEPTKIEDHIKAYDGKPSDESHDKAVNLLLVHKTYMHIN